MAIDESCWRMAPAGKPHRVLQAKLFSILKESETQRSEVTGSSAWAGRGCNLKVADPYLKRGSATGTGQPRRLSRAFIRLLLPNPFQNVDLSEYLTECVFSLAHCNHALTWGSVNLNSSVSFPCPSFLVILDKSLPRFPYLYKKGITL